MGQRERIYYFNNMPEKFLYTWVAEDISEDMGDPPGSFFNIAYFIPLYDSSISALYFSKEDNIIFTTWKTKPDAFVENPEILKPNDEKNPLKIVGNKLYRYMIEVLFEQKKEVKII